MKSHEMKVIAHMQTDFPEKFGIPRQSGLVKGAIGKIVFEPEYRTMDAVRGMDGYSYLWVIWQFSKAVREEFNATVAPPRLGGKVRMGVFATRSPFRPNAIGLSSVKIERIEEDEKLGPVITVSGIDMLDGTPIYDIKPYLVYADSHPEAEDGFAAQVWNHRLQVIFPRELLLKIDEAKREALQEILAQDPRTAFIRDEERIWGVTYAGYNVRFRVVENELFVVEVSQI